MQKSNGLLALEDGSLFEGWSMGAEGEFVGEVVFNTSMTGYQEIMTDPSYWGQMVTFTCPHIGNVGVNAEDVESRQPFVRAIIARQIAERPSNWRAAQSLPDYLRATGVPALSGVDTRRLTLTLRNKGVMRGALSTVNLDRARLLEMARNTPDMSVLAPVSEVSRLASEPWAEAVAPRWVEHADSAIGPVAEQGPHVVVIDCGVKHNILRLLAALGARVTVAPATAALEEVLALAPDGVLLANGPGDPEQAMDVVRLAQALLGRLPIMGICLGHQIIGLAAGARTYKLPFGHHGGNHPVQDLRTGQVAITAQNHNYAVEADSLRDLPFEITHINLYDNTVEGMRHLELPVWSIQYHPEASPGPHDSLGLLREFVASLAQEGGR
jgi:carbamoyl-phosphate synthase small subunit